VHYYIDGYNLLFRLLHAGENLRSQREILTQDLKKKVNLLKLDATLVFDSHYQPDEGSRSHIDLLEIVFTAVGETADEYILQEVKEAKAPGQLTVVTSDKKLAWLARLRLANTISAEEFVAWLNKRYKNRLRQLKAPAKELKLPAVKPQEIEVKKDPEQGASPQDCFGYYLESFEKELEEQVKTKKPEAKKKRKKIEPIVENPKDAYLSDYQRWMKAFEGEES